MACEKSLSLLPVNNNTKVLNLSRTLLVPLISVFMFKNVKTKLPFKKNVPEQAKIDMLNSGVGMLQHAQTLISIGAQYNKIDVNDVLLNRHKILIHV